MIIPVTLLTILGIAIIYSSSPILAIQQAIFVSLGLLIYSLIKGVDYRVLRQLSMPAYILVLILLIVVFFLGVETRGSLRWIPIGPFNLQPSEFSKPVLILALAHFWSENSPSWKNIFKSLGILFPFILLIFKQPDLGTSLTLSFIWFIMLVASNISALKLFVISASSLLAAPVGWILLRDYQKQRLLSFLSPNLDPQGIGYNVIQSMIAIGSGQLTGRGLGRGTQSRLRFLPEFRTDFIFASIAEELGLIGSLIVISLYLLIFYFLFRSLARVGERMGELLVIGVSGMLFIQIVINIGMNSGLLPITGITLPLLSYGGSSILTILISLGLVASVDKFGLKKREIETFAF